MLFLSIISMFLNLQSMKRQSLVLSFFLFSFTIFAQTNTLGSAWIRDNYYKREQMIPMRDGIKLFTAIYIPKGTTEKHPILVRRTPYSAAPFGENNFPEFWNSYHRLYLGENYIMVVQDVRGRYTSKGEFMDIRPFNLNQTGTQVFRSFTVICTLPVSQYLY